MLQQALLLASSSQENNLKQTLRKIPCVNDTSHGTIFAHYYTKEALDINTPTPYRRIEIDDVRANPFSEGLPKRLHSLIFPTFLKGLRKNGYFSKGATCRHFHFFKGGGVYKV